MERRDPYRLLHVIRDADPDVVRAAYRVLARKLHPDGKAAPLDAAAEKRMADLNWAYAQIRDQAARQAYERQRFATAPPTAAEPRSHGAPLDAGDDATGVTLDFGRYAGWTLRDVARRDLDYLVWLRRHASGARFRPAIDRLVREQRPAKPAEGRRR